MKHISRTRGGYIVRKRIEGRQYQAFFGDSTCGTQLAAKAAAVAYRDRTLETVGSGSVPRRFKNSNNVTGMVGVSWYPPHDVSPPKARTHYFRARVATPGDPSRLQERGFSVGRYGLWGAFHQACDWRYQHIHNGANIPTEEVAGAFETFIESYFSRIELSGPPLPELLRPLSKLVHDPDVPQALREEVRMRHQRISDDTFKLANIERGAFPL